MEDIERLKMLLEVDAVVQEKMKIIQAYSSMGLTDYERKIVVNWDNYITREIFLLMNSEFDVE